MIKIKLERSHRPIEILPAITYWPKQKFVGGSHWTLAWGRFVLVIEKR